MGIVATLQASQKKPKEKCTTITKAILADPKAILELFELFQHSPDPAKGLYADVIEELSTHNPALIFPYLDILIAHINYKAPHVTWGVQEALGNMATDYPAEVHTALPHLMKNTTHTSTVVRWCAAYAIAELTIHTTDHQDDLIRTIKKIITKEKNNGVRNVYLKALKKLGRDK